MCTRIYILNFKKSSKAKETKEEKRIPLNSFKFLDLTKKIWDCLGEDFSCHSHLRKQEYFFRGLIFDKSTLHGGHLFQ